MEVDDATLSSIKAQKRKIRNLEVVYDDFVPLLKSGQKITGTIIDAFAGALQSKAETQGSINWCIFPSWLALLVTGKVSEKLGTQAEHILEAVSHSNIVSFHVVNIWDRLRNGLLLRYSLEHYGSFRYLVDGPPIGY